MNLENKSKTYKTGEHIVYSCQYHVIFCPKYRRKVLIAPYDDILKQILLDAAKQYQFEILEMEVMPDHVHLLVDCDPRFGIANCIKKIKSVSAHILRKDYKYFQSKLPTLWTRSYFVSSVGSVSLETVKKYIEEQKGK